MTPKFGRIFGSVLNRDPGWPEALREIHAEAHILKYCFPCSNVNQEKDSLRNARARVDLHLTLSFRPFFVGSEMWTGPQFSNSQMERRSSQTHHKPRPFLYVPVLSWPNALLLPPVPREISLLIRLFSVWVCEKKIKNFARNMYHISYSIFNSVWTPCNRTFSPLPLPYYPPQMIPFLQSRLRLRVEKEGRKEGKIILTCNPSMGLATRMPSHRHQHRREGLDRVKGSSDPEVPE